jgi:hypothetical protein
MGLFGCLCSFNFFTLIVVMAAVASLMIGTSVYMTQKNYKQVQATGSGSDASNTNAAMWATVGGLTSTSAQFRLRLSSAKEDSKAKFLVYEAGTSGVTVSEANFVDLIAADGANLGVAAYSINNLTASSQYTYQFVTDGSSSNQEQMVEGKFSTPGTELSPMTFSVVTAGCAWTGSFSNIFGEAAQVQSRSGKADPLLMIQLGDLHYTDYNGFDVGMRMASYDTVFDNVKQRQLYNRMGLVHMWDDHDYLGNDSSQESDKTSEVAGVLLSSRDVALQGYTLGIPHYEPLPASSSTSDTSSSFLPPYQAFTIGTVRFIITDLRSECQPSAGKMYSDTQKAWLFDEISNALDTTSLFDYVVWISSKPWNGAGEIATPDDPPELWSTFPDERRELSNHIYETQQSNGRTADSFMILSADAHMVGFDDGSNSYYGDEPLQEGELFIPVLHSGPLDRVNSIKGDPLSDGCYTTGTQLEPTSQYSVLEFVFPENNDDNSSAAETGDADTADSAQQTSDAPDSNSERRRRVQTSNKNVPCVVVKSYTFDYQIIYQREWCQDGSFRRAAGPEFTNDAFKVNTDTATNCLDAAMTSNTNYAMMGIILSISAILLPLLCYCLFRVPTNDNSTSTASCLQKMCCRQNPLCFAFMTTLVVLTSITAAVGLSGYVTQIILSVGMVDSQFILGMALGQALVALLFVFGWACQFRRQEARRRNKSVDVPIEELEVQPSAQVGQSEQARRRNKSVDVLMSSASGEELEVQPSPQAGQSTSVDG